MRQLGGDPGRVVGMAAVTLPALAAAVVLATVAFGILRLYTK